MAVDGAGNIELEKRFEDCMVEDVGAVGRESGAEPKGRVVDAVKLNGWDGLETVVVNVKGTPLRLRKRPVCVLVWEVDAVMLEYNRPL